MSRKEEQCIWLGRELTLKMYSNNIPKQIYSIAIEFECQIHLNVLL